MVLNATFSNISAISWPPVLVVEEAGVPADHRPWASNLIDIKYVRSICVLRIISVNQVYIFLSSIQLTTSIL